MKKRDDFCKLTADRQLITLKTTSMLDVNKITETYFIIDGFLKEFNKTISDHSLNENNASYNRFVELQKGAVVPMALLLKTCCLGQCTGISIIDSTPLRACHIRGEKQHKTFKGLAAKGHTSTGWFIGFKLHLIINDKGEV